MNQDEHRRSADKPKGKPQNAPRTSEQKDLTGYRKDEPIVLTPKEFVKDVQ